MANTYRRRLWDVAIDQYGYVTTRDAADLDIPSVELRKLAQRGSLVNVGRGLYRFDDIPSTSRDEYMEAVLFAGADAVLSHDAVLGLHDLGFVNPSTIRLSTPHRVRKTHPRREVAMIRRRLRSSDLTRYFGIPSTTVARALLDCTEFVTPGRLEEAVEMARREGLLLADEYQRVKAALQRSG